MTKQIIPYVTRLFLIEHGKIFLLLRNGKNGNAVGGAAKRWIAPGGMSDTGESAEQCVVRETEEEIGIKILQKNMSVLLEKYDPKFNVNMVFYTCHTWSGTIRLLEPEKFEKTAWVKPDDLGKLEKDGSLGIFIQEAANKLITHRQRGIYESW